TKKQEGAAEEALLKKELKNAEPEHLAVNVESFKKFTVDHPSKLTAQAYLAESAGLAAVLYGPAPDAPPDAFVKIAKDALAAIGSEPVEIGGCEVALAKVYVALVTLPEQGKAAPGALSDAAKLLDDTAACKDSKWAKWANARILLAAGERKAAKAA